MRKKSMHVILMASVLVFSSIAGCLGNDDEKDEESFTVIASTYHVAQLAEAVSGGLVDVEMMSTTNVPVHDYEPSPTDIVRLTEADVFLYHGLGLEPWVDGALADVENDNPDLIVRETHAVADGSQTLLFNEMMINTLCSDLSSLSTQDIHILHETMYFMEELHSDDAAYNMGMPDDHDDHDHDDHGDDDHDDHDHDDHGDDDHDDHGDDDHDGHDHDDHGDDDHDDHDGHDHGDHDGHDHGNLEKMEVEHTYSGNPDCPADTTISVYELEAGEYVLEFESGEIEAFKIAIAAMGGAHHHHHHGHGDGAFEWAGIFEMSDDTHTWSMQKVDGSYADQTMKLVLIPTESTTEETMHSLESGVEALMEGDCTVVEDGETMSSISDSGSCFDLHVGSGDDSTFTMNTAGISGLAIYAQHVPIEFERNQHYLKDSTGEDIEPKAEEGADGHAHAHGDEEEDGMSGKAMIEMGDTNDDAMLDATEFLALMEMFEDEDGDHEGDHDHDHDHDEEHDEDGMSHEMEEAMWNIMFSTADMNADNMLEEEELNQLIRALEGDYFDNPAVNGELFMTFFDADEDGVLSLEEFEALMETDSDEDDHDDHWEPNTCHDEDTHETHDEYTNEDDCEAAGYMWMDEDGHDDHDHDDHDEIEMMFNMTDANSDGSIDSEELLGMMSEDSHEEGVAFIGFHVEEEGDYGFALPEGVKLHVLSMGGHEGHDHGAHGDEHDDHADEDDDDHDDHGDDHDDHGDDADALAADPHSWLDPVAYSAQVEIVYNALSTAFPDNADAFRANADAYKAQLADLDGAFTAAFGENGTCQKNMVAANHNAYAYISYRYGIEFVNLHGLDPEGEPSPAAVAEVLERVEEDGVIAIYVEEYTPNGALDSLIQDTKSEDLPDGIQVLTLYTLEMAPADSSDNYITLMTKNLENLKTGLAC